VEFSEGSVQMSWNENRAGAFEEANAAEEKTNGKSEDAPKLNSRTENRRNNILSLEKNKKEAAKPLYLLRYE
jgi:hypothetical protein